MRTQLQQGHNDMARKIGLIDADLLDGGTRFPNLALMKLSAWHKTQGQTTKLPIFYYTVVYASYHSRLLEKYILPILNRSEFTSTLSFLRYT